MSIFKEFIDSKGRSPESVREFEDFKREKLREKAQAQNREIIQNKIDSMPKKPDMESFNSIEDYAKAMSDYRKEYNAKDVPVQLAHNDYSPELDLNKNKELYAKNEQLLGIDDLPDSMFGKLNKFESSDNKTLSQNPTITPTDKNKLNLTKSSQSSISSNNIPQSKNTIQSEKSEDSDLVDREMDAAINESERRKGSALLMSAIGKLATSAGNLGNIGKLAENQYEDTAKQFLEQADDPVKNIKTKRDQYEAMLKNKELKDMANANSDISVAARDLVRSMGMSVDDNATAMQLNKILPYLNQKYNVDEAKKARAMQSDMMKREKDEKLDLKNLIAADSLRKELFSDEITKMYQGSIGLERVLQQATKPGAIKNSAIDFGLLMASLKSMQGDNSVVREAELNAFLKSQGIADNIENALAKYGPNPQMLTNKQKQNLLAQAIEYNRKSKELFQMRAQPIIKRANAQKIPIEYIIPDDMNSMSASQSQQGVVSFPKQVRKDGQVATVKNQEELDDATRKGWM